MTLFLCSRNGNAFNQNVRDSPDTSSVHIGGGPMDADTGDMLKCMKGSEGEKQGYNPLLNRMLEHPTS